MDEFLVQFKNSYMLVPIAMILSVVFAYIENLFNDCSEKDLDQKEYIKYALVTGIISLIIIYISNIPIRMDEEISLGNPPF